VGAYPILVSGASSPDYTIAYRSGTLTVARASTSSVLIASGSPSVFGQAVSFTVNVASVSPGTAVPSGSVTFFVDGNAVGSTVVDSHGQATFQTAALGIGSHAVTAAFSGSSEFASSQTGAVQQVVAQASTQTVLTATAVRNRRGQIVAVDLVSEVLVISPGSGVPSGPVSLFVGKKKLGSGVLSNGQFVLVVKPARVMGKAVIAQYGGDADFRSSVSPAVVVNKSSQAAAARPFAARFFHRPHMVQPR
jgi:hypothetical protein